MVIQGKLLLESDQLRIA